jgi:hypothetical protein
MLGKNVHIGEQHFDRLRAERNSSNHRGKTLKIPRLWRWCGVN